MSNNNRIKHGSSVIGDSHTARCIAVGVLAIGLLLLWAQQINGRTITKDGAQNVQMALNVERYGVMSLEDTPPYTPTNYREPLPVFVSAAVLRIIDAALGPAPPDSYFQGERAQLLKYLNILWLALLSLGTFWAIRLLSSSFYLGLVGVVIVNLPFVHGETPLNGLYTEIPAAALLMFASLSLANLMRRSTATAAVTTGVLFGILILTKAALLYVFVGAVVVVATIFFLYRQRQSPAVSAARLLALFVGFSCVVGPWMYRNYVQLGTFHISQRAGVVLLQRAEYDLMSPEEIRGSFYVWASPELQPPLGHLLGFSSADLKRHGRLQHLNEWESDFEAEDLAAEEAGLPDKTFTYYREARAERVKLSALMRKEGKPEPEIAADDAIESDALQIIEHHPWHHLLLTISLVFRGASLMVFAFAAALWVAVRRRDWDLLAFTITAAGAVLFYALFSEFLGRFSLPLRPIAVAALLVALYRTFVPQSASTLFLRARRSVAS
jgi:hypothetical protein